MFLVLENIAYMYRTWFTFIFVYIKVGKVRFKRKFYIDHKIFDSKYHISRETSIL